MLKWDGSVHRDSIPGHSKGATPRHFDDSRLDSAAFDPAIVDAFTKTCWLEIKRIHKLDDNDASVKKGEEMHCVKSCVGLW